MTDLCSSVRPAIWILSTPDEMTRGGVDEPGSPWLLVALPRRGREAAVTLTH